MRVLLSAYACEPNRGSEPEVGWQRALHMLAIAEHVYVLTRSNNRAVIEADPSSRAPGLHFIYYDLPGWALRLKKQPWFLPVYFILWQWGAYRLAARRHHEKPFDAVYHVTFASMQFGSFMGRLGIPFVIGPIAGGERSPLRLRRGMPIGGQTLELMRDLGILLQRCSPLSRSAFGAAEHISVTTAASLRLVSRKWRSKTSVHLAIATPGNGGMEDVRRPPDFPRYVFAGRLLHWKGVHLAIRALAETRKTVPAATLTLVGSGPDERRLRHLASQCGVENAVEFVGQLPRPQFLASLQSYTALVFPSLHDSGGFVVLEALQGGRPAVCLDLGGPATMVNSSCGIVVPTAGADQTRVVSGIANAMIRLGTMPAAELWSLSLGAIARANELSWASLTQSIAGSRGSGRAKPSGSSN
jgi:glycosyltransferase involved in cell wall biosynthesis